MAATLTGKFFLMSHTFIKLAHFSDSSLFDDDDNSNMLV